MKQFALIILLFYTLSISAQVNPLDPTFGNNGEVNISRFSSSNNLAVQVDGKIVVIGAAYNMPVINGGYIDSSYNLSVCRLNIDGSIDSTFGINGFSTIDVDTILFPNTSFPYNSSGSGIFIQTDNKILVTGGIYFNGFAGRLNSDGTLDTLFGNNGLINISNGIIAGKSIKQFNNGTIVCGGVSETGLGIMRLLSNGNIDTTFGNNGIADSTGFGSNYSWFKFLFEDVNGSIIAVGGGENHNSGTILHKCKVLSNGILDNTYSNGLIQPTNNYFNYIHGAILAGDGSLLVSGTLDIQGTTIENGIIYKFTPNGDADNAFGTNGYFQNTLYSNFAGTYIESDGKLIIAGNHETTDSLNFCLYRLNSNGSVDNTFGTNGYIESNQSTIGTIYYGGTSYASTRQADGKILIIGKGAYGAHIERFSLSAVNAVDENNTNEVVLYPNPVTSGGYINLNLTDINGIVQLIDMQGKIVLQQTVNANSIIAPTTPGMYFMRLISPKGVSTQKVVVE